MALPTTFKTPGVYIDERNAFPNSVVAVETAVPAFIGYTEKATYRGQSLLGKPIRIESIMEFIEFYGGAASTKYTIEELDTADDGAPEPDLSLNGTKYHFNADASTPDFKLYDSLRFFYQNGGASCFIISVGTYAGGEVVPAVSKEPFSEGILVLEKETVPTMLLIPDSIILDADNCYSLQQEMLMHCGEQQNRVAILDIYDGFKAIKGTVDPIGAFRNKVASDFLNYGAAYYPWLHTTVVQGPEVTYKSLNDEAIILLKQLCRDYAAQNLNAAQAEALSPYIAELSGVPQDKDYEDLEKDYLEKLKAWRAAKEADKEGLKKPMEDAYKAMDKKKKALLGPYELAAQDPDAKAKAEKAVTDAQQALDSGGDPNDTALQKALAEKKEQLKYATGLTPAKTIHNALNIAVGDYKLVMESVLKKRNLLAPAAAMAGIYSLVDAQRGVWKAPGNVAVSSVVEPAVLIDFKQQEDLNAPIMGKAICAIRPFIGLGTMVWGARTLDANSMDWRYINVRRTMIMMEQSIKFAAKAYVFEPNVKNTWVSVEAMIANFLTNLWKQGALAGAVPADAFSVNVGLGTTMTAQDILEGVMRIEVKVAVSRPAEFIAITFEQQMQKS